ncbi:MAG: hypothetical protein HY319_08720 [Armatimonadetes bacterium]|nr:hypothetical protein [Armatimonadota bacterium]
MLALVDSGAQVGISAVAWYEFSRGPRTPQQLAVARSFFGPEGVASFSEAVAADAAEVFRSLGCPRTRGNDIAIGVTAVHHGALLLTRNMRDFAGIPDLQLLQA